MDTTEIKVIKSENGPVRINASDFIEGEHELHVADDKYDEHGVLRNSTREEITPARGDVKLMTTGGTGSATATDDNSNNGSNTGDTGGNGEGKAARNFDTFGVMQKNKKFFVVDGANGGEPVDDVEGIEPKGYATNQEAWAALLAIKAKTATDNA